MLGIRRPLDLDRRRFRLARPRRRQPTRGHNPSPGLGECEGHVPSERIARRGSCHLVGRPFGVVIRAWYRVVGECPAARAGLPKTGRTYQDLSGAPCPYLTDQEVRYLTIPKGSLDEVERLEIESHVSHTYNFLKEIPWTRELHDIPLIAYGHHEKLDGHGYPRGVTGDAIPLQTRMMTISDIYDALTAADRPYKPAVAPARALDIMDEEVRAGQLDGQLLQLFVDAKVFEPNA